MNENSSSYQFWVPILISYFELEINQLNWWNPWARAYLSLGILDLGFGHSNNRRGSHTVYLITATSLPSASLLICLYMRLCREIYYPLPFPPPKTKTLHKSPSSMPFASSSGPSRRSHRTRPPCFSFLGMPSLSPWPPPPPRTRPLVQIRLCKLVDRP
jgi:hypothetical protein